MQLLNKAEALCAGSPDEVFVLMTSCAMAINKHDVGWALKKMRAIPRTSPAYRAARAAIADVSLTYRRDKRAFVAAHLDIVSACADYDAYVQCGDAFSRIHVRARS